MSERGERVRILNAESVGWQLVRGQVASVLRVTVPLPPGRRDAFGGRVQVRRMVAGVDVVAFEKAAGLWFAVGPAPEDG